MIDNAENISKQAANAYLASGVIASSTPLQKIAASLALQDFPGAIFAVQSDGQMLCAAAPDWRQWQRLVPLLTACIGYNFSNFPLAVQTSPAPPYLTTLLGGYAPALWCNIDLVQDISLRRIAINACERLVGNVLTHSSLIAPPKMIAGVSELLVAYESAMSAGQIERAGLSLEVLTHGNYLDALNARFLRLRWLAAHGDARQGEALQVARELVGLPLPMEVSRLVDRLLFGITANTNSKEIGDGGV